MAVYYCLGCDLYFDNDYFPCAEHPDTGELVCEDCLLEAEDMSNEADTQAVEFLAHRDNEQSRLRALDLSPDQKRAKLVFIDSTLDSLDGFMDGDYMYYRGGLKGPYSKMYFYNVGSLMRVVGGGGEKPLGYILTEGVGYDS